MMDPELYKAILGAIPVLSGVTMTGVLGAGLGFWWNLRLKRREADIAAVKAFHELYGEFFAVWKLWNCYIRDVGPDKFPDASRWNLLERACAAEGKLEAILINLTFKYKDDPEAILRIAHFRQVYKELRKAIKGNKPLTWDYSEHPIYTEFKNLAPTIAYLVDNERLMKKQNYNRQTDAWSQVTENYHENYWDR